MRALFDLIHDRSLIASTPTGLLTPEQRARLEGLTRLLAGDRSDDEGGLHRRSLPRVPVTLPMLITQRSSDGTATIYQAVLWDVSGDGLGAVALGMQATRGTFVEASFEVDETQYTFPARVAHVEADGRVGLQLSVTGKGTPTREVARRRRDSETRLRGERTKRRTA